MEAAAWSAATAGWVAAVAGCVTAIAAIVGFVLAIKQLRSINETLTIDKETLGINKQSQRFEILNSLMQLESEMNRRKLLCSETIRDMELHEVSGSKVGPKRAEVLGKFLIEAKENWFNSVDRLCYCIIKEYFPERDWKVDYKEYIRVLVDDHEDDFGPKTIYTNIIDLHEKWKRE